MSVKYIKDLFKIEKLLWMEIILVSSPSSPKISLCGLIGLYMIFLNGSLL